MNSQRQSGWGFSALPGAKPGKGGELAAFLQADRELAVAEQGTVTWHVFKRPGRTRPARRRPGIRTVDIIADK